MEFIIVTGYSGAGKSHAINALEDIGYYCIDNVPSNLMKNFAELISSGSQIERVAFVTDARGSGFFGGFMDGIVQLNKSGIKYKILFLEATSEVLAHRYKETRRKHPLLDDADGSVVKAIDIEREMLSPIRGKADYIIDTSLLSTSQFKERIIEIFAENPTQILNIQCMSFGFKYGPATEADMLFDVRCLPNPFYVENLRQKTGLDKEVSDFVLSKPEADVLLNKLFDVIDYLIPLYEKEGKSQLVIAIGCTGGKHRSVTFAESIYKHLQLQNKRVGVYHRDIDKRF